MKPHERRAVINTCRTVSQEAKDAEGTIDEIIHNAQRHKATYRLIQNTLNHIAEHLEQSETDEETAN